MKGKNAIVTGARTGIGLAILKKFAGKGINVWAVVHRDDPQWLSEIESLQKEHGVWIRPVMMDLEKPESIKEGFMDIRKEKKPIDILVNCAGYLSPGALFQMTKMEEIRKAMEINFFSVIYLTQLVARMMTRNGHGSIVNISSIAAWGEDTSQMEYAASKSALVIATKKIASELGSYNIRVNAIAPGPTETKMISSSISEKESELLKRGIALKRFGLPEEIADVCMFLASDQSRYVTGQTIKVNGGGFDIRTYLTSPL